MKPTYLVFLACLLLPFIFQLDYAFAQDAKKTIFKKKRKNVVISELELRLRLTDYFISYTEYVEETADKIYRQSSEPEIKRASLMWKIYGISAMNKAINMSDPFVSFLNAWPLAKQTVIFFESGLGKEAMGDYHKSALDLSIRMEHALDSIIIDIGGMEKFLAIEPDIDLWVDNHPIEDFYFTRESTIKFFAKWLGETHYGIGGSVATMTEQMLDLSNRINIYADILPRQARWQADFALMNYLDDTSFILSRVDHIIADMERITKIIEKSPELIEYNREAILKNIDEQRRESLQLLVRERKATIDDLIKERIEIAKIISNERMLILEAIKQERSIVLEEVKKISSEVILESGHEAERIIDKVMWRIAILLAVLSVIGILGIIIYKKL